MKLFEWGKSKTLQPQTVLQQVKKSDPRSSNHGQDQGMHTLPCKSSNIRKQRGLFEVDDDDYLPSAKVGAKSSSGRAPNQNNDEKLHDTIRFVFSVEQEGLLAIGTFALEQLTATRDTRTDQKQISDGFESCTDFSDEDHLPRIAKSTCEFPSHIYSSGDESDDEEKLKQAAKPDSKALSLYIGNRSPVAGTKPFVLLNALPPELRQTLDLANPRLHREPLHYVPLGHWTDSAAPPVVVLPKANVDQDYYSSYFCGLFSSQKSSLRSETAKRISTQKKVAEDHEEFSTKPADQNAKKSLLNFGTSRVPSIEKLAKLWRSSCLQSSARIAPERKSCSPRASQTSKGASSNEITSGEVLTTPVMLSPGPCDNKMRPPGRIFSEDWSPKVAEFTRRAAMHERNMEEERRDGEENDGGHWIKDDSEYVVLEM